MSTVGYATLPIIPSLRGMESEINKQLGGLTGMATRAGGQSGQGFIGRFGSSLASGLDSVGETVTRWAGRGFTAVGVTAGAVMAAGLWGGLNRALDREDAIVTFRRMGLDDVNITQLTSAIDTALSGTPIANPEGFALAGRFLAQGFDSADIPSMISTLADMSSVGNRSFQEMADVMVAAAGAGRITAAELNRLGDVPLGKVAEQLGTTESGLREMVSTGALTAEAFIGAFAAVEEFNGAAKDATTRVAFTNLRTAVSSLGEQFLGPLLGEGGAAQRALLSLREVVSGAGPSVAALGQSFADWLIPAVGRAAAFFSDTLVPAIQSAVAWFDRNRDTIGRIAAAVGPAVVVIGALATGIHLARRALLLLGMSTPVGLLMALGAGLIYAWQNSETFRNVVTGVMDRVAAAVGPVVDWVSSLADRFGGGAGLAGVMETVRGVADRVVGLFREGGAVFDWVSDLMGTLQPRFDAIGEAFGRIGETLAPVVQWLGDRLPGAFETLWNVAQPIINFLVTLIGDTLAMAIDGVVQVFEGAVTAISGILEIFAGLFTGDWSRMWEGIKTFASGIFGGIVGAVRTWLAVSVAKLFRTGLTLLRNLWSGAWNGIRTLLSNALTTISNNVRSGMDTVRLRFMFAIDNIVTFFRAMPGRVLDAIRALIGRARTWAGDVMRDMRGRFTERVADLIGWFRGIPDRVISAVTSLIARGGTWARDVIQGMRQAFRDRVTGVLDWFRGLPGRIIGAIPNPLDMLRDVGKDIIQGMIGGITSMGANAANAVGDVARGAVNSAKSFLGIASPSKVFAAIGEDVGEGFALGIGGQSRIVELAARDLAGLAERQAQAALGGLTQTPASLAAAGTSLAAPAGRGGGETHYHLHGVREDELVSKLERERRLDQVGAR